MVCTRGEGLGGHLARFELAQGLDQRRGDADHVGRVVGVGGVGLGQLEPVVDAVDALGDGRGEGQVG